MPPTETVPAKATEPKQLCAMGLLHKKAHAFDKAGRCFAQALEIAPNDEEALFLNAEFALQRGNSQKAIAFVRRQLTRNMHVPTLELAQQMVEQGEGGDDFKNYYYVVLQTGMDHQLLPDDQIDRLMPRDIPEEQRDPSKLSPLHMREVDLDTEKGAVRSRFHREAVERGMKLNPVSGTTANVFVGDRGHKDDPFPDAKGHTERNAARTPPSWNKT